MRGVCIWWLRWISQSSGMVKWRKDVLPSLKMSNLLFLILRWLSKGHSFSPVVVIFKNGFQERELSDRFTWQGIEPKSLSLVINALEKSREIQRLWLSRGKDQMGWTGNDHILYLGHGEDIYQVDQTVRKSSLY